MKGVNEATSISDPRSELHPFLLSDTIVRFRIVIDCIGDNGLEPYFPSSSLCLPLLSHPLIHCRVLYCESRIPLLNSTPQEAPVNAGSGAALELPEKF